MGSDRRLRFLLEHRDRPCLDRIRLGGRVSDRGQSHATALPERTQHVEHHAGLPRMVEVQAVAGDDVEQVVGSEGPKEGRDHLVARDKVICAGSPER